MAQVTFSQTLGYILYISVFPVDKISHPNMLQHLSWSIVLDALVPFNLTTGGIYQVAGYIRHTQLSTARNMT